MTAETVFTTFTAAAKDLQATAPAAMLATSFPNAGNVSVRATFLGGRGVTLFRRAGGDFEVFRKGTGLVAAFVADDLAAALETFKEEALALAA